MRPRPNLFTYATSELSQDAVLCYWAAWAHRDHEEVDPELNALGRALVGKIAGRPIDIRSVVVMPQVRNIDVAIVVNDDLFIVVEDKTETAEHGDQLNRYRAIAEGFTDGRGRPWGADRVATAYVKTGNAPKSQLPGNPNAVLLDRRDLLSLLGPDPLSDQVFEQFRQHLTAWETETTSFETTPLTDGKWTWDRRGQQGFYMWLEDRIGGDCTWHYVANPAGGFIGYYWNWRLQSGARCRLYLQIEHCRKLQVRVADVLDEHGEHVKAPPELRYRLLAHLRSTASNLGDALSVEKSGRFKRGWYGGIADLLFEGNDTFLALGDGGVLDQDRTLANLRRAMALVDRASSTPLPTG